MTTKIPFEGDVILANSYSSTMWVLYAISVVLFLILWHSKEDNVHRKRMQQWINDNRSLVAGILTTAVIVYIFEGIARIVNCIVWSYNSLRNNTSWDNEVYCGVFLAVWLPQVYVFIFGTMLLIGCHIREVYTYATYRNSDFFIHIILHIYLTVFGLVYVLFPAIILTLAYPTQMLATFIFVLAYLFATTIYSAILYEWCEQYCHFTYSLEEKLYKTTLWFIALIVPIRIIFVSTTNFNCILVYSTDWQGLCN